jgi:hypothetical protein
MALEGVPHNIACTCVASSIFYPLLCILIIFHSCSRIHRSLTGVKASLKWGQRGYDFKLVLTLPQGSMNLATADVKENVLFVCRLIPYFFQLQYIQLSSRVLQRKWEAKIFRETFTNFGWLVYLSAHWPASPDTYTLFHGLVRKNTLNPLFNLSVKMKRKQSAHSSGAYPLLRQSLQNYSTKRISQVFNLLLLWVRI